MGGEPDEARSPETTRRNQPSNIDNESKLFSMNSRNKSESGRTAPINLYYSEVENPLTALATGFNVGTVEFDNSKSLMIYGLSEHLDAYFRGNVTGRPIPKPTLKLTRWWRDLLQESEKRAFRGWTEVGMFLLNASRADQWKFEKEVSKLKKSVSSNWQMKAHDNFLICTTGPAQRLVAFAAYVFKDRISREKRDANLKRIFDRVRDETGCKGTMIIGIDADESVAPYQCIALAFDDEGAQTTR